MAERQEEDVLSGVLLVVLGSGESKATKTLPIRTVAKARDWKRGLLRSVGGGIGTMNLETIVDSGDVASAFGDRMLDLVVSYDESASLGGREWLEQNATDAQVYSVFRRLLEVSFPFVRDLRTVIVELRALGMADLLAGVVKPAAPASSDGSLPESSTSASAESSDSGLLVASSGS